MWLDLVLVSDLGNGLCLMEFKKEIEVEGLKVKRIRETFPLSHKVQVGPHCFLKFLSEKSLGAAGSRLHLRPGLCFVSGERNIANKEIPLFRLASLKRVSLLGEFSP